MKKKISEDSHFVAHFLAKYEDSYELLGIGNQAETHKNLSSILKIPALSFKRLRDEYDGFYSNRTGYSGVVNRKSRVEYKSQFESLSKEAYLEKIKTLIESNPHDIILLEPNEKRISRIAYNSNGWVMPSGPYGKSKHKESHEAKYGYGHEEWLFDTSKLIDGYHYGFLEPIRKQQDAYIEQFFNVWLYTIDGVSKNRYWVGEISNLEVINQKEANSIKLIYQKKGWLREMEEQIVESGANNSGFSDWEGVDLFNVRFKTKDLTVNDPYYELSSNHPINSLSRYNFSHFKEEFEVNLKNDSADSFSFNPDEVNNNSDETEGVEKVQHKREPKTIQITYLHKAISRQLTKVLKGIYGKLNVKAEHSSGIGGKNIEAGTYALYTIPGKKEWTIIIHKNIKLRSLAGNAYNKENDAFRFNVTPQKAKDYTESFTIQFSDIQTNSLNIQLLWENTNINIPIEVEVDEKIAKQMDELLKTPDKISHRTYFKAAQYYLTNDKDLNKAVSWIEAALKKSPKNFRYGLLKAKIQDKAGKSQAAINTIKKANTWARDANNANYIGQTELFMKALNKKK